MKTCNTCNICKDDNEFVLKYKKTGRRQNKCRECSKKYSKEHYEKNKSHYIKRARAFNKNQANENKRLVFEYLKDKKCLDCGNDDARVLEFDHKEGLDKFDNIGNMVHRYSWKMISEEIEKCEIRCANCHRIKTVKQFNWFRNQ